MIQLSLGASEHELFRYVMQSFAVFEQAVYARILDLGGAAEDEPIGGLEPAGEGARDQPHRTGVPDPQEISDAIASVRGQDNLMSFGLLEEAVER